jgi:hypothetical protein
MDLAKFPVREVGTLSDNDEQVGLAAILASTAAETDELDAVVALQRSPHMLSVTWSVEATS